jgi:hypothetical protein
VPPRLDIQQVKTILNASDLIASWQVLIEDETTHRALYKIRCRALMLQYSRSFRKMMEKVAASKVCVPFNEVKKRLGKRRG